MGSPSLEDLSTEELFRRFAPFVARFLYRLGVGSDSLDDLVQEVFLVVHRRGGYKAGPAKPTSYLATIAVNAASAYRRRRRIEQSRSSDAEVDGLVSTSKGPVQILEVGERLRLLQAALDRLEPDFRSTLVLADIEGESCASIAASSGVPAGTVYWRLHEARKRFQKALRAEAAGIPARHVAAESEERERRSVLALAVAPLWFFTDARKMLREGAAHAPVHYDVNAGLEAHRQLASTVTASSHASALAMPAVTGIGLAGLGGAGVAAVAAIAAAFFVHSSPRQAAEPNRAAPGGSVVNVTTTSPTVAPEKEHSGGSSTRKVATAPSSTELDPAPSWAELDPSPPAPSSGDAEPVAPAVLAEPVGRTTSTHEEVARKVVERSRVPAAKASSAPENPPPAHDAPIATPADSQQEAKDIARAERMLPSNPAGALAIVQDARARFKPSFLPQERDYVEVMALHALSRSSAAEAAASRFLSTYPGGAFASRVRKVMGR